MNIALSLIPLLIRESLGIVNAWNSTPNNATYIDYLVKLAPEVGKFISDIGALLFPGAASNMQLVGGSIAAFNPNYTKLVQGQINVLSPALKLNIPPLVVDGIYGPRTKAGIEAVQEHFGIVKDGIVGNITQGWIAKALATLPEIK